MKLIPLVKGNAASAFAGCLVHVLIVSCLAAADAPAEKTGQASNNGSQSVAENPHDRAIRFFEERIQESPESYLDHVYLANRLIRKSSATGDEALYARAEDVLRKALEMAPDEPSALLSLAEVLCKRHQFADGLAAAQRVYEADQANYDALAVVGDAQLELGQYEAAQRTYAELVEKVGDSAPGLLARQARVAELAGKTEEAIRLLEKAQRLVLEDAGDQLTTVVAWYLVRLAELHLECGQIDKAAAELEHTVAKFPDYYLALAGLGKARTAQGRYSEAIDVFRRTIAVRPDPLFYMAKGDLHAKLGNVRAAQREYALAESSILESGATPAEYGRELSLFYSERNLKSARALELAQADLALRQDIFAYDTLAWALYRNARWQEGAEAIEKALRLGTRDARLHYHAGMIYHRLARPREASEHLRLALSINPRFSILGADEARKTLASMKAARTTIGRTTTGRTTTGRTTTRRTSRRTCGACGKRS